MKIQPCDPIQAESSEEAYEDAGSESDANTEEVWESSDEEDGSSNQKSMIRSSIEMIAGSLEDFLEKLKIDCRTVSIELTSKEGSPSCSTKLSLSLKELSYETKTEDHGEDTGVSSAERVSRQISFNGLSLMLSSEDAADASASDDEFHDALGSPCSISAESNVKSNVLLLGNPSGDGLSGLVTIREIKDGTGLAEKIHTSIDVQVCSPTVYINRDSIRECLGFVDQFLTKEESQVTDLVHKNERREEEGGQIDILDSVLFPDCKSIAADILPAFIAKAEDDINTPAEAFELASSVEEFFDAGSRMTASSSAFEAEAHRMASSTILKIQNEERSTNSPEGKELQVVLNLHVDDLTFDLSFEESKFPISTAGQGLALHFSGIDMTKYKYVSGIQIDLTTENIGISCYGNKLSKSLSHVEEALTRDFPSGSAKESNAPQIVRNLHGKQHLMLAANFYAGSTEVHFKSNCKLPDESSESSCKQRVEALLQPMWVMIDADTLKWLLPKAQVFCSDVKSCFKRDRREEGPTSTAVPHSDDKKNALSFTLECDHIRIVAQNDMSCGSGSNSAQNFLIFDVLHQNLEEKLLRITYFKKIEIEMNLSEAVLSFHSISGEESKCYRILQMSAMSEMATHKFKILCILQDSSESNEQALCSSFWEHLNERFIGDTQSISSTMESGDKNLKTFYLQEKAINESKVFVHFVCGKIRSKFCMDQSRSLTNFMQSYSSIFTNSTSDPNASKDKAAGSNITVLIESCMVLDVEMQSCKDALARSYVLEMEGIRVCGSYSSICKFSMIHASAQRTAILTRKGEEQLSIVEIHSDSSPSSAILSCAVRKDQDSMSKVIALVHVKYIEVSAPTFLLEQEGTVIEDVCSMFNEPSEETPMSLKVSAGISNLCLALDIPPVHDALEDVSLSRTELTVGSVACSLDFGMRKFHVAIYDPSLSLHYRESSGKAFKVFKDPKIVVNLVGTEASHYNVQVFHEEISLLFNEDCITGFFQLVEYLLEHLKKYFKSDKKKSEKNEAKDSSTYRKLKMEKLRMEKRLLRGSDTPWVIIDDWYERKGSMDSDSRSEFDVDIDGCSHLYASAGMTIIDDYIPVPELYEDESVKDEDAFANRTFQESSKEYPAPSIQYMYKIKTLNLLLETRNTTMSGTLDKAEEGEGSPYQIRCKLTDFNFLFNKFGESDEYAWHTHAAIKGIEVRESFQNKSLHALFLWETIQHPIEDGSYALSADFEMTRPDIGNALEDEMNIRVSILPLLIRLNPNLVHFLADFLSRIKQKLNNLGEAEEEYYDIISENVAESVTYIKKCEVLSLKIRLDHTPQRNYFASQVQSRRVLIDLLNLVPLHGVELSMKTVVLHDTCGLQECAEQVIGEWLEHVAKYQAGKFVVGIRPFKSIAKVGAGARKLITLPLQEYKEQGNLADAAYGLKRGAKEFLHAVSLEVLQLGANIAGFGEVILSDKNHQAENPDVPDIRQGLQQASSRLSSGIHAAATCLSMDQWQANTVMGAVVATAGATAGAIRCTLIGARNSLDPERYYEDKLRSEPELSSKHK